MSETSPATAIKHDSNKLRMDLIPPEAELALAEILTYGANKYADRNWEKGFEGGLQANWDRIYGALRRHLLMYLLGERLDQESGKPHLWHALCCVAFLVTYEARGMLPLVVTYGRGKDPTAQVTDERGYNEFNSDWRETVIGSVIRRSPGTTFALDGVPAPEDKLPLTITAEEAGMGSRLPWWGSWRMDDVYGETIKGEL